MALGHFYYDIYRQIFEHDQVFHTLWMPDGNKMGKY